MAEKKEKVNHPVTESRNHISALLDIVFKYLLNFNHFPSNIPWHSCYLLREKDNPNFILTLDLVLHFIEIKKVENCITTDLAKWV